MKRSALAEMHTVIDAETADWIRKIGIHQFLRSGRRTDPPYATAEIAVTKVRPRGAWVTKGKPGLYSKFHLIDKSFATWLPSGVTYRVDARCGAAIWLPRVYVEPPEEFFQLCDQCVFADEEMHVVYRFFGVDDELLYVGYSGQFLLRLPQHRTGSKWWPLVRRCSYVQFADEKSALAAEVAAQILEKPIWNFPNGARRRLPRVPLPLRAVGASNASIRTCPQLTDSPAP